ncbi:DUF4105 domain-containing protein [Psychrobacter sp. H8-1]|uniref:Lnb N-terminal periplasmic domain-containing protein n=1 Tax=Psychrobacter sp. H8-1 TaxID=2774129 RepID=UPI001918F0F1|nr:DUF4105 domain-containing protein [Psychrobacter sp. H8-1]
MSLRNFFSKFLSSRKADHSGSASTSNDARRPRSWRHHIVQFLLIIALILSALWLLMAVWYQLGATSPMTWLATIFIIGSLTALLSNRYWPKLIHKVLPKSVAKTVINHHMSSKWLAGLYAAIWLIGAGWFVSLSPQQDRDWQPEVSQRLSYERDANNPDLITFTNIRNFDWHTSEDATERWETRTVDMSKLSGVDIINSYWMGPLIAHTLVSFRFEDERPLSFSLEIRKENGESFSSLGGLFKRYELSLIAAEERDIIYTRSNARGEQVYLFPVSNLKQSEVKSLFESYLTVADELNAEPAWYNTLTSNCTNIIFYMARIISGERLPWDYRIWASGWLPNYLYEIGMLPKAPKEEAQPWSMDTWYERAHINPKVRGFDNQSNVDASANSSEFSTQIRQDLPIPMLTDANKIAD